MFENKTVPAKYIFLDVVGFTHKRSVEAQADIVRVLNDIVESSIDAFALPQDKVMFIASGDDICIALLNIETPYDIALLVALRIIEKVNRNNEVAKNEMRKFEVRIGVNSHIDNLVTDINGHQNIAGAGINLASRLMRLADGNQILVGKPVFEDLSLREKYFSSFKTFRARTKGNNELFVYQFISNEYRGLNTQLPQSLQSSAVMPSSAPNSSPVVTTSPVLPIAKVEPIKPAPPKLAAVPPAPQPKISPNQTQPSILAGILPEMPVKAETVRRISPPPMFLEQMDSPKHGKRFLRLASIAAVLLICGAAAFGIWTWMDQEKSAGTNQSLAENSSPVTANTATTAAAAADTSAESKTSSNTAPAPENSTIASSKTPVPSTTTEKAPPAQAPASPNSAYKSNSVAEASSRSTARRQPRIVVPPPAVRARPAEARVVAPQQSAAKKDRPKSSRKLTFDDLLNER